jgi:hypothetical protein
MLQARFSAVKTPWGPRGSALPSAKAGRESVAIKCSGVGSCNARGERSHELLLKDASSTSEADESKSKVRRWEVIPKLEESVP